MSNLTPKQVLEKYNELPEKVRLAYSSEETTETIQQIGKKYNLHVDQMGELANQIGLIMIGVNRPDNLINQLKEVLKIEEKMATEIATAVNVEIFSPLREHLKNGSGFSDTSLPAREQLIREIENPTPIAHTPPSPKAAEDKPATTPTPEAAPKPDIFAAKMSQMFSLPRTETSPSPEAASLPKLVDPYHEPIE